MQWQTMESRRTYVYAKRAWTSIYSDRCRRRCRCCCRRFHCYDQLPFSCADKKNHFVVITIRDLFIGCEIRSVECMHDCRICVCVCLSKQSTGVYCIQMHVYSNLRGYFSSRFLATHSLYHIFVLLWSSSLQVIDSVLNMKIVRNRFLQKATDFHIP